MGDNSLEKQCVDTIRMLAADMVQKANSGHPGMPMGAAPMAYLLYCQVMKHNPADPKWADRDRFVLSAGHGSALLYAILHLTGYGLSLADLKNFRQWKSSTPGHPEHGLAPGVEATTGPLGQGLAMAVGMALAERFLAEYFNRERHDLINHYTYTIAGDGDLMEGVASEAVSLAATLGLSKLVVLYDDNHISIEGPTDLAFSENRLARFRAYGWHALEVEDGNDLAAMRAAIDLAKAEKDKPSIIAVRTSIGYGSPRQDMAKAHGEPLGETMAETRKFFAWPEETFFIPPEAGDELMKAKENGAAAHDAWQKKLEAYTQAHPGLAARFQAWMAGELPPGWEEALPTFPAGEMLATRKASGAVINALAQVIPNLVGGSADLAPSTKTIIEGSPDMRPGQGRAGRNIHFGVREFAMTAMVNGMSLHGGVLPFGATFFVFSDYMRPALRLAAIMKTHSLFVLTHDSVGLGEDGPTHQPVEHLMSLRAMPGLTLIRPADANETAAAWEAALKNHGGPVCLVLSRQGLANLDPAVYPVREGVAKGAYVLDCDGAPDLILLASGSEVGLIMKAAETLRGEGIKVRVVSMPSWELFAAQDQAYQDQVLPPEVRARLAVEAGTMLGWERYVGKDGAIIGLDRFGESAPGGAVMDKLGFSPANVAAKAKALLK